jgi:hypothetical protein
MHDGGAVQLLLPHADRAVDGRRQHARFRRVVVNADNYSCVPRALVHQPLLHQFPEVHAAVLRATDYVRVVVGQTALTSARGQSLANGDAEGRVPRA